jgi:ParB family chromosome partitioning protein
VPEHRVILLELVDEPEATPREVYEDARLIELAESIRSLGLLQPPGVVAVGDRFRRVFGKRRLLACRWLGLARVDVMVLSVVEAQEFEAAVAENTARVDLSPLEEARAVRHMLDVRGKSVREVAAAMGHSESWVRQRRELLLWPSEVLEHVGKGELSVSVARELVLVEDERARSHYLGCAVSSGCTAAQMRQWRLDWEVQRTSHGMDGEPPPVGAAPAAWSAPTWPCVMCEESLPVTSLTMLRVCVPCVAELDHAKREARRS